MDITDVTAGDIGTYGGVAAFLPVIVSIINRPHFPAWAKQLIMVAVAVIAAAIAYGTKNGWDFTDTSSVVTSLLGVAAATQVAYRLFWSKGLSPAIEKRVNSGNPDSDPSATAEVDEIPVETDEGDVPADDGEAGLVEDDPSVDYSEVEPAPEHAADYDDGDDSYEDSTAPATSPVTPAR